MSEVTCLEYNKHSLLLSLLPSGALLDRTVNMEDALFHLREIHSPNFVHSCKRLFPYLRSSSCFCCIWACLQPLLCREVRSGQWCIHGTFRIARSHRRKSPSTQALLHLCQPIRSKDCKSRL